MATSYVYIIQNGKSKSAPIKIGMSDDPQSRLAQLQTGNPVELLFVATIPCKDRVQARRMESHLHNRLARINIRGEWFKSTNGDINRVLKDTATHTGAFEYVSTTRRYGLADFKAERIRSLENKIKNLNKSVSSVNKKNKSLKPLIRALKDRLFDCGISWDEIGEMEKAAKSEYHDEI